MRYQAILAALAFAAAACSSSSPSYGTGPGTTTGGGVAVGHTTSLSMYLSAFSPSPDTVAAGSTVTWSNNDGITHTVTSASGGDVFDAGNVAGGSTYQHTYNTAGTYTYYCKIHGTPTSGMRGTIVVR